MNPRRRVAITGIGMVTPVGNDAPTTWANLQAGRSGCATIRHFDASGFPARIGAEVKDFDADCRSSAIRKLLKFASRSHRFALAAAEEAFARRRHPPGSQRTAERWGFSVGAGMMGVTFNELQTVHAFCGRDGEFNPDGLLRSAVSRRPGRFLPQPDQRRAGACSRAISASAVTPPPCTPPALRAARRSARR